MAQNPDSLPITIRGRLTLVGRTLYGNSFRAKLAEGLGIGRSTLWQWMTDGGKRRAHRDVDAELIDLIDSERDATDQRGLQIDALRRLFVSQRSEA